MEEMELICFKIISAVGEAKSDYISALEAAKKGDFAKAEEAMKHGDSCYVNGHKEHAELITKEAGGERTEVCLLLMHADLLAKEANGELNESGLLLMHAEDQLMAAETIKLLASELIELYKK